MSDCTACTRHDIHKCPYYDEHGYYFDDDPTVLEDDNCEHYMDLEDVKYEKAQANFGDTGGGL